MTGRRSLLGSLLESRGSRATSGSGLPLPTATTGSTVDLWMARIATALQQFDEWLVTHQRCEDYWPAFGELVRRMLNESCGASRVLPYEITSNGRELLALRASSGLVQTDRRSVRKGIIGHVVTTGRSYVASHKEHGELIDALAKEGEGSIAWCFLVQYAGQRLGVVTAGTIAVDSPSVLSAIENVVGQCWFSALQARRIEVLQRCDPVCEVLARPAFLAVADQAVADAYQQGAPVAVAVLSLEGLRAMNDSGRWEVADDLLREVSKFLRAKVRSEDHLGRFDGMRFVLLLRCVDSELATLIVRQLIAQLTTLVGDFGRWGTHIKVRSGLAGSGTARPTLRELVTQAVSEAEKARLQNRTVCSDILDSATIGRQPNLDPCQAP